MTHEHWLSLRLPTDALPRYKEGAYCTVEAIGPQVVGILRRSQVRPSQGSVPFATLGSPEEAAAVATILRVMNPI